METSRRMYTPADGGGRGNKSHGTFNTALSTTETTPISLVLLKHKRHDLPYPTYCFGTAREGTAVGLYLTEVVCS
ncbi:MAG: hypothetical protein ABJ056_08700, partial [Halioglobus sp.]